MLLLLDLPDWVPDNVNLSGSERFYVFAGILGFIIIVMLIAGLLRYRGSM